MFDNGAMWVNEEYDGISNSGIVVKHWNRWLDSQGSLELQICFSFLSVTLTLVARYVKLTYQSE